MRGQRVPVRVQVWVFCGLFSAGMWASKLVHPLYFEQAGQLGAFGVGYAVMALMGGLSVVWGRFADSMGGLRAAKVGMVVYALGIAGRVIPNLPAAVVSSAVAGAGASLVIVAIRPWVRSVASDHEIPRIVAAQNAGNQSGILLGSVGVSLLLALPIAYTARLQITLLVAPVIVLLGWAWLARVARGTTLPASASEKVTPHMDSAAPRGLTLRLVVIGVVSGLYVSLLAPYAPLILTDAGVTVWGASLVVGGSSLLQLGVSWVLSKYPLRERHAYRAFIIAELVAGGATVGIAACLGMSLWIIILLYLTRAAVVSVATIAEDLIRYLIIPAASIGVIFGFAQTAFLSGDALGGLLATWIWQHHGPQVLILTAGALTFLNAALMASLLRTPLRNHQALMKSTN